MMARTYLLLAAMTAIFLVCGYLIGGGTGMLIALIVATLTNLFAYWNSDKMVLSMYGAREIGVNDAPEFYNIVANLAHRAELPMPRVFIIESDQPNAFATGRDPAHAAVAATTGLLRRMSPDEIKGVMAHELAHVKNRDTLTMTIAATIAGAIGMLANLALFIRPGGDDRSPLRMVGVIAMMILAPMAAMLVQMAISRSREYVADAKGAEIAGSPLGLANALETLGRAAEQIPNQTAESNPATAHLFIVNPLRHTRMDQLFTTHPPLEDRVARLRRMAGDTNQNSRRGRTGPWG